MALLQYLKPINSLPDPKGPLTSSVSSEAIAAANKEVHKTMSESNTSGKKSGHYKKYTATQQ